MVTVTVPMGIDATPAPALWRHPGSTNGRLIMNLKLQASANP